MLTVHTLLKQVVREAPHLPDGLVEYLVDADIQVLQEVVEEAVATRRNVDPRLLDALTRQPIRSPAAFAHVVNRRIEQGMSVVEATDTSLLHSSLTRGSTRQLLRTLKTLPCAPAVEDAIVSGELSQQWLAAAAQECWAPARLLGRVSDLWDQRPNQQYGRPLLEIGVDAATGVSQQLTHQLGVGARYEHLADVPVDLWSPVRDEALILEVCATPLMLTLGTPACVRVVPAWLSGQLSGRVATKVHHMVSTSLSQWPDDFLVQMLEMFDKHRPARPSETWESCHATVKRERQLRQDRSLVTERGTLDVPLEATYSSGFDLDSEQARQLLDRMPDDKTAWAVLVDLWPSAPRTSPQSVMDLVHAAKAVVAPPS